MFPYITHTCIWSMSVDRSYYVAQEFRVVITIPTVLKKTWMCKMCSDYIISGLVRGNCQADVQHDMYQREFGDYFVYGLNQWETTLQSNVVSHWLNPYTSDPCYLAIQKFSTTDLEVTFIRILHVARLVNDIMGVPFGCGYNLLP